MLPNFNSISPQNYNKKHLFKIHNTLDVESSLTWSHFWRLHNIP